MKALKLKIFNWLLTDDKLRKVALREVIGDAEVKQVIIESAKDLTISNCYIYQSHFKDVENFNIENNVMDYCSLTGFIAKEGIHIK